jgi:hypothetical protein
VTAVASLRIDAGGSGSVYCYDSNHTSNTAIMWRTAGCDIAAFHDKSAREFGAALSLAIDDIEFRPGYYAQWNPENGWGNVETTLDFLRGLRRACEAYPLAEVRVSR